MNSEEKFKNPKEKSKTNQNFNVTPSALRILHGFLCSAPTLAERRRSAMQCTAASKGTYLSGCAATLLMVCYAAFMYELHACAHCQPPMHIESTDCTVLRFSAAYPRPTGKAQRLHVSSRQMRILVMNYGCPIICPKALSKHFCTTATTLSTS